MSNIRPLLLLICLLPFHYCFSATIYVNISNPTPGTGTSWATAFTDLNAALAAANAGDQVWVAQGTYYPTTTTDRTLTFAITKAISVYGGFNGTETTLGARNWTTNPTILSGDIGVTGDATDNSYSVVTITSNFSSATLDGFTVTGGNGNQGLPSNTSIVAGNLAGGIAIVAYANQYTGALIDHCTLINNFGIWGGGICAYSDGANAELQATIVRDLLQNNSGYFGGGMCWVAQDGGKGLTQFESCIFNGNTSPVNSGSAILMDADNSGATGLKPGLNIDNCTFYNNPAPVFYNVQQNTGLDNFYANGDIIWQSGGVFPSPIAAGTGVNIIGCNLDLATSPGSGNIITDPMFINAAAGDFRLQTCSPDVDVDGIPTPLAPTDYYGNPRVQNYEDYGAYETQKTVSPAITATPATYCQNATASPIAVASGTGLLWYTTATGGTGSATDPVPSTTTPGTTDYWVTQTLTGGCESSRTEVTITVNPGPTAPTTAPVSYCENTTATALTATGASLLWYTAATGGTGSAIAPTPATTSSGMTPYFVTQTSGGCESPRAELDVTVNAQPAAPTATAPAYCQYAPATALTATGTSLTWYTTATGGTGTAIAPTPGTTTAGTESYYVTQTVGCESPRTEIDVTINAQPAAPAAAAISYCQNAPAPALTATGTYLTWYTTLTGGTGTTTAPTPNTTTAGLEVYYVSQTVGCESPRTELDVTINPNPQPDFTWTNACAGSSSEISASTPATGYTWNFGSTATPTGNAGGPYEVTWPAVGDYAVTLTAYTGTCTNQVTHEVKVFALPKVGINPVTGTVCVANPIQLISYGAATYQWSPATYLSDPTIADPTVALQQDMTYTVTGTDANGCTDTAMITMQPTGHCSDYYIPSAFTPNGDGHNDNFHVITGDLPQTFSMMVFNRYGVRVFASGDVNLGWDGTIGGKPAASGAYVFVLDVITSDGTAIKRKGTLVLTR